MSLYHFTCVDHGHPAIQASGVLRPNLHRLLPELGPIVWLTDLAEPTRDAVGLTSVHLSCDRLAVRYELRQGAVADLQWWPFVRERCAPNVVADLQRFGLSSHWWITGKPVPLETALIGWRKMEALS